MHYIINLHKLEGQKFNPSFRPGLKHPYIKKVVFSTHGKYVFSWDYTTIDHPNGAMTASIIQEDDESLYTLVNRIYSELSGILPINSIFNP